MLDDACSDAKEAALGGVIGPMIRPLITVIASSLDAASDLLHDPDAQIGHHIQNIEDALIVVVKTAAEAGAL